MLDNFIDKILANDWIDDINGTPDYKTIKGKAYRNNCDSFDSKFRITWRKNQVVLILFKRPHRKLLKAINGCIGTYNLRSAVGTLTGREFMFIWSTDKERIDSLYDSMELSLALKGMLASIFQFGYVNPKIVSMPSG